MSFDREGPRRSAGYETTYRPALAHSSESHEQKPPTAAEVAQQTVDSATQGVGGVSGDLERLRKAERDRDPRSWTVVHRGLAQHIADVRSAIAKARTTVHEGGPDASAKLDAATQQLDQHEEAAKQFTTPPLAYKPISREDQILAALQARPAPGDAHSGFQNVERELKAEIQQLAPAEWLTLSARLARVDDQQSLDDPLMRDPVVVELARLRPPRQAEIRRFLADSKERHHAAAARGAGPQPVPPASSLDDGGAAEPDSVEAKLRRMIEAGDPDPELLASLDGTTRRTLARRLEGYRPGSGDELAARFTRRDRVARDRIFDALRGRGPGKLPDEIRGDLEGATGRSLAGVRVHDDDDGHATAATHGARAVAIGSHIYMGEGQLDPASRDGRELLAHEVAHTVQADAHPGPLAAAAKRDGASTEAAEVEADQFAADFVARGASAKFSPSVSVSATTPLRSPPQGAIAHDKFEAKMDGELAAAQRLGKNIAAPGYVHLYIAEIRRGVDEFLLARTIPTGDPQVAFTPDIGLFMDALFKAFDEDDSAAKVTRLRNWLAPADLYALVDRSRPIFARDGAENQTQAGGPNDALDYEHGPKGPPVWTTNVAAAIAATVDERLVASLARMSPQLVAVTAKHRAAGGASVRADELVPSHPLDWQVALAMIGRGVPTVLVKAGPLAVDPSAHVAFKKIHRIEWQGAHGGPWNAVRVEPTDAGVEAVAAALAGQSTEAYGFRRIGPFYLVPEDIAVKFPEAREHFDPTDLRDRTQQLALGQAAGEVESVESERAIATAKAAPQHAPIATQLHTAWQTIDEQLQGIATVVRPYGVADGLSGAVTRHKAHATDLDRLSGHDAIVRGELFAKQTELLAAIAGQVAAITRDEPSPKPGDVGDAKRRALGGLVRAADLSQLPETGKLALDEANAARRGSVLEPLDQTLGVIATQIEIARQLAVQSTGAQQRSARVFGASLSQRAEALGQRVAVVRSELLRNQVDPGELETLYRDADALRFETGLVAQVGELKQLYAAFDILVNQDFVLIAEAMTQHYGEATMWRAGAMSLIGQLNRIHGEWLAVEASAEATAQKIAATGAKDADQQAHAFIEPKLAAIRGELRALGLDKNVQTFLRDAFDAIDDAKLRTEIVMIATMIGIAVISSVTGGVAGGVAEGLGAGAMAAELTSLAVETVTFTALQAELTGEPLLEAFATNGIANLLTFGAMRGVGKLLEVTKVGKTLAAAKSGQQVRAAAVALAKTAQLTAELLVSQGIQIAQAEYESVRETGHTLSLHDMAHSGAQGMAMMIGAAIGHRVLAEPIGGTRALGDQLGKKLGGLRRHAAEVETSGNPTSALALVLDTRAYVDEEAQRATALAGKSEQELAAAGLTRDQAKQLAAHASAQRGAIEAMDAGTLAAQVGLDTVVPGRVFAGEPRQIDPVLADFRARGYNVEHASDGYHVTKRGEPPIEVLVRPGNQQPHEVAADRTSTTPAHVSAVKRSVDDHLGDAPSSAETAHAKEQAEAEASSSLAEQAKRISTGRARSERDVFLAIKNGELPRYIARVGPANNYPTFADPNRPFIFATEPADLRGVTPAEALWKVGWLHKWAKPHVGKEIVVTILDTHAAIETNGGEAKARVGVGKIEWSDVRREALSDQRFIAKAESQGISQPEIGELFDAAAGAPISEAVSRAGPARASKMRALLDLLESQYAINELYTGIGAMKTEAGEIGGREVMVRGNGTGLRLTPENHTKVSLGVLTPEDFDAVFGQAPRTGGHP